MQEKNQQKLDPETIDGLRSRAEEDLFFFAKGILGFDWLNPRIHLPLCRMLEDFEHNTKLKITLPRGWLKTTLCSQAYPIWRAVKDPAVRILLVQNTFTNALAKNQVIKNQFEGNELLRALWPEVLPDSSCTWKAESLCLKRPKPASESTFECAGTRTQVTSRHYDVIIEDDTVAPDLSDLGETNLCPTKDDIAQAIGWHRLVPPLLISPSKSQNLVVGTRWFEKDLLSWIAENESKFLSYERACLEKDGVACETGDVTYPERFDMDVLESLRDSMGPYMFSCLYLNFPLRSQDMLFKQEWFEYYSTPPRDLMCYTTVDPGGAPEDTKGEPDFNVVLTCGKEVHTGRVYLLEYSREKCNPGRLIEMIFEHVKKYSPVQIGLETAAYQKSLQYWIRERQRTQNLFFLVKGLTHTKKSKSARIQGLQPVVASKMLLFKKNQAEVISELLSFPLGKNDDLADALAMQLELWQRTTSAEEEKEKAYAQDPLSFSVSVKELRDRHKKPQKVLADPLDYGGPRPWSEDVALQASFR